MLVRRQIKDIYIKGGGFINDNTIAYYPLEEDLLDHKNNGNTDYPLTAVGNGYQFTTNVEGKSCIYFSGSTYLKPGNGNIRGIHPGTDDCTIAFRICGFTSPAYGTLDYSGYHTGILSFASQFKTGVGSDGSVGMYVGLLDNGYEGFTGASGYDWDKSTTPPTMNGYNVGQTYLDTFLSVVDTFESGHHTRYISTVGADTKYFEANYNGGKSVSVNYIGWDNYSSSNYRYMHGYMKDFVVAGDVRNRDMIDTYFNG